MPGTQPVEPLGGSSSGRSPSPITVNRAIPPDTSTPPARVLHAPVGTDHRCAHRIDLRMGVELGDEALERAGHELGVVVKKQDVLATAVRHPEAPATARPDVAVRAM